MQQRQLRLGDILDDYCPRERRVTNHVIVAMIGDDVKQVRCTTCDADHEFKHAKVPRQRRKSETPAALYAQVLATGPKRRHARVSRAADGTSASPSARRRGRRATKSRSSRRRRRSPRRPTKPSAEPAQTPDEDERGRRRRQSRRGRRARSSSRSFARRFPRSTARRRPRGRFPSSPSVSRADVRPTGSVRAISAAASGGGGQQFQGNRSHGGGNGPRRPAGRRHALERRPAASRTGRRADAAPRPRRTEAVEVRT